MTGSRFIRRLGLTILGFDIALVVAHLVVSGMTEPSILLAAMFGLDREANLPTWFASSQLLLAGACFLVAAWRPRDDRRAPTASLSLAGGALVFLSADEAAGFHESVTWVLKRFESLPRFSGDHGLWIPIYGAVGLVALVGAGPLVRWLRRERRHAAHLLLLGAVLLVVGAVGVEILSYGDLRDPSQRHLYVLQVAVEEGLELLGGSLLLLGACRLAAQSVGPLEEPANQAFAAIPLRE